MSKVSKFEVCMMGVIIASSVYLGHTIGENTYTDELNRLYKDAYAHQSQLHATQSLLRIHEHKIRTLTAALADSNNKVEQVTPTGYVVADTGIKTVHLRRAISSALKKHNVHTKGMEELLIRTAAIETANGNQLYQMNNGPAKGIFQMEPATEETVLRWMKKQDKYKSLVSRKNKIEPMVYDLEYQIMTAAAYYTYRTKGNIPEHTNDNELWQVYKKYWNTHLGATKREFADTRIACLVTK